MRTTLPAYPIVIEGVTLQVGSYAQTRAWELRGRQPIQYIYYPALRELRTSAVAVTAAAPLLQKAHPLLQQAWELLRGPSNHLLLNFPERMQLKHCVGHLRSAMGSSNFKLDRMLNSGLPLDDRVLTKAYDKAFIQQYAPLVIAIKEKGLTTEMVEAFMNSTPYHEDEVLIHTDDSWRLG